MSFTELTNALTSVINEVRSIYSFYDDMSEREKMEAIRFSIETKCPHELFIKLYNLSSSISTLRSKRAELFSDFNKKKESVEETLKEKGEEIEKSKPIPSKTTEGSLPNETASEDAKKPLTDYQKFVKEMRPIVKKECPTLANGDILKEIARRWKEKTTKEKEPDEDPAPASSSNLSKKDVIGKKEEGEPAKKKRASKKVEDTTNIRESISSAPLSVSTPIPTSQITPETAESVTKNRKQAIPKYIKSLVWKTYIGESSVEGTCQACKISTIYNTSFHCGHVIAEVNGGDHTISNLRPICADCNSAMGTTSMVDYVKRFFGRDL
jgi:5-methylcytosine-specific restriction endonuclease McrA